MVIAQKSTLMVSILALIFLIGCGSSNDDNNTTASSSTTGWKGWTEVETANVPTARYRHSMAYLDGKVILFAGDIGVPETDDPEGNWDPTDDTWEYDVEAQTWTEIKATSGPQARLWHGLAATDSKIVLFGGWGESYQPYEGTWTNYLSDTWEYDLTTQSWSQIIDSDGITPYRRSEFGMVHVGGSKIALFGGRSGSYANETYSKNTFDDVWVYDSSNQSWTEIEATGDSAPKKRFWPVVYYAGNDVLVVMGGADYTETPLTDGWEMDLNTGEWTEITLSGDIPSNMFGPFFKISDSKYILADGNFGYQFDPSTKTFSELGVVSDMAERELWSAEVVAIGDGQAVMFGGRGGDYPHTITPLNDTWIYTDSQ